MGRRNRGSGAAHMGAHNTINSTRAAIGICTLFIKGEVLHITMCCSFRESGTLDVCDSVDKPLDHSSCGMKRGRERHPASNSTTEPKKMSVDSDSGEKAAHGLKPHNDIEPWKTMGCGINKGKIMIYSVYSSLHRSSRHLVCPWIYIYIYIYNVKIYSSG